VAPAQADDHTQARKVQELLPCPVPCSEDTFVLRVEGESIQARNKATNGLTDLLGNMRVDENLFDFINKLWLVDKLQGLVP